MQTERICGVMAFSNTADERDLDHCLEFNVTLPSELWLVIFTKFHPVYDDLFSLSLVCRKWRSLIVNNPYPSLWEKIVVKNIRNCRLENTFLLRFKNILKRFGSRVKLIRLQKCHELFTDILLLYAPSLSVLNTLEIAGMPWSKRLLQELRCWKSLRSVFLEASCIPDGIFNGDDLAYVAESFPHVRNLSLQYSVINNSHAVAAVKEVVYSKFSDHITCLLLERARMDTTDLRDIVKQSEGLKTFGYGNDQIHGLPSIQQLQLTSKSLVEIELFQVGDFAEFHFVLPHLKTLILNGCTSVCEMIIDAPALRTLHLLLCVEVRNLNGIYANSLNELKIRRCNSLIPEGLANLLLRNPDITTLELEVSWTSLQIDHHSAPSVENVTVVDNGERLTAVDIQCPKLKYILIKKSSSRSTILKVVSISSRNITRVILHDVPYLRKVNIDANNVQYLEVNFERRLDYVKPFEFTKLNLSCRSFPVVIDHLVLKRYNLKALVFSMCNVRHISMEHCNLDCPIGNVIFHCGKTESLTLKNCYGSCQLNLSSDFLRKLHVISCTSLLVDHINLACPSLEVLSVSGLSSLPSQQEINFIASNVRELSPFLGSVQYSQ